MNSQIRYGNQLLSEIDRKADKKINIDKYSEIDRYIDEYTDITDGKIDLVNSLGSILTKATVEIPNETYIINDLKQKENLDIKTLKTMHETLEKVLIKWMKTISSTIKNDKFGEYDMKPARPSSKKDKKPTRTSNRKAEKSKNPDTDKDIKPDTDKDIKLDSLSIRRSQILRKLLRKMLNLILNMTLLDQMINQKQMNHRKHLLITNHILKKWLKT